MARTFVNVGDHARFRARVGRSGAAGFITEADVSAQSVAEVVARR